MIEQFPTARRTGSGAATSTFSQPNQGVLGFLLPWFTRCRRGASLHMPGVRAAERRGRCRLRKSGRPRSTAHAEEHGALARGRGLHRRPVRGSTSERPLSRRSPLRPVERPDRRDRRLHRQIATEHPEVQLALVGSMAHDDPEGWDYYSRTVAHATRRPDVHTSLSEPEQHRLGRGECLQVALGRR